MTFDLNRDEGRLRIEELRRRGRYCPQIVSAVRKLKAASLLIKIRDHYRTYPNRKYRESLNVVAYLCFLLLEKPMALFRGQCGAYSRIAGQTTTVSSDDSIKRVQDKGRENRSQTC
jgi:hypothetical protein